MKTITRHPLTITYTVMVPDEVIDHITSSDGTLYWVDEDFTTDIDENGTVSISSPDTHYRYQYNTAYCLRGIALWIENGGEFNDLLELNTDYTDHDHIWQYGFFGTIVYG